MSLINSTEMNLSIFQSLVQWSRQFISPSSMTSETQHLSHKKSKNGKGTVYLVPNDHPAALVTYKFIHEDGEGSILLVFYHLRDFYSNLDKLILKSAESGNLSKVELLCKQRKNILLNLYTHRLQIFRVKEAQTLVWLIDLDFHKSNSYGSGTGVEVIKSILLSLLNESSSLQEYGDFLDEILQKDWLNLLLEQGQKFYKHFKKERLKCVFYKYQNPSSSSSPKPSAKAQIHNVKYRQSQCRQ